MMSSENEIFIMNCVRPEADEATSKSFIQKGNFFSYFIESVSRSRRQSEQEKNML